MIWAAIVCLMAASQAIVLTILLNPIRLEPLPPPAGKPLLTILVDQSASMATVDTDQRLSRWRSAAQVAQDSVSQFESEFEVRLFRFAEELKPAAGEELDQLQPMGSGTDLATPILDSLVSDRPQGQAILLISDGIHNLDGSTDRVLEAAALARSWDAPIYTWTVGSQSQIRDLEIQVPRSQELAFVGQSIPVTIEIQQQGRIGDRLTVVLETDGQEIASREVRMGREETVGTSFLVTPEDVGLYQYQVRLLPIPGEATTANNVASFQIRVVDDPVRALVLEGKPYWDAKFLLRMLTQDPALEVDFLVKVTERRSMWRRLKLEESTASATTQDSPDNQRRVFERTETTELLTEVPAILQDLHKLRDYQILLLGREAESYLTGAAVENIRQWLAEDGGSLICYRGAPVAEPDRQLARILPLRWSRDRGSNESRFRVQVTERGDDLSWLRLGGGEALSKLPSLATTSNTESIQPLAVVLGRGAQNSTTPVLTYQPYGTGKVVVIEGAGMWRWAFLAPEFQEHDPVYGTLWQSLLRWVLSSGGLLPGEMVSLQMDRVTFTAGEAVSAIVLKREDADSGPLPPVELRDADGQLLQTAQPIPVGSEPGVYQVFLGKPEAGSYEVTFTGDEDQLPGTRKVRFDVRPDLREQLEIAARPELMSRIAELSDGEVLQGEQLSSLANTFQSYRAASQAVQYRRIPVWDRWWVLVSLFLLWSGTWAVRRSHGLV